METMSKSQADEILKRLAKIEARVDIIVEHVADDSVLTEDDLMAIKEAEEEYKQGKTISHEQLKKELGLRCSK